MAGVALEPEGSEAEAAYLRAELESLAERVRTWDAAKQDALEEARDPAFWEADERHDVLGLIEYLDRLGAATATAERLGARLSSGREAHSRELVQLLARRLHVLAAALAGLDAREASDATVTVHTGHAEDTEACRRFVQELANMYVGWAMAAECASAGTAWRTPWSSRSPASARTRCSSRRTDSTCSSYRTAKTVGSIA